jgi:hypothetical protein
VEIVLTTDYYNSLKDHAVPFDFRALKAIQQKPRAQDIYLWMTQRLCRLDAMKPLLLRWQELYEMFGGQTTMKPTLSRCRKRKNRLSSAECEVTSR